VPFKKISQQFLQIDMEAYL